MLWGVVDSCKLVLLFLSAFLLVLFPFFKRCTLYLKGLKNSVALIDVFVVVRLLVAVAVVC
jgi:hypothetical protein